MAANPKTPKSADRAGGAKARAGKAKPEAASDAVADADATDATGMRLKDLVDKVAASVSIKKNDVRAVVEAALGELGTALKSGQNLNLAGLGRLRVARTSDEGDVLTLKLRLPGTSKKAEAGAEEPLADAEDQV